MEALQELLAALPPGPIPEDIKLDKALAACWDGFRGSDDGGMKDDKLLGRMENVQWQPPILTFTIERHGGTVNGSTRAELQHWEIKARNDMPRACRASLIILPTSALIVEPATQMQFSEQWIPETVEAPPCEFDRIWELRLPSCNRDQSFVRQQCGCCR